MNTRYKEKNMIKRIRIIIASILTAISLCSIFIGVASKIKVHADEIDLSRNYWELTTTALDSLSRRTSILTTDPQITVFTHELA